MHKTETWKLYLAIASISFIQGLQYCVSPVLGEIQTHYPQVDVSFVQMLITGPALLAMVVSLISGGLAVKVSIKKLVIFAGFLSGVTGLLPLVADSFWLLFVCRMLYGVSLGLAMALNTAVVAQFFTGEARVTAMGVQAASIGAGMVVVAALGGMLGGFGFRATYWVNLIGFLSMVMLMLMLPEKKAEQGKQPEKISLNAYVYQISLLGLLEFLFLISFTTNISMHLSGELAGSSAASGTLTSIFSATQIVAGLILAPISRVTKRFTLAAAMLSFAAGCAVLVLFPGNFAMLAVGAVLCGLSQGVFVPTAMVEASNAVAPVSAAMAAACYACAQCLGQFISPTVLNGLAQGIFGNVTTSGVYLIAAVGMILSAVLAVWIKRKHS